MVAAHRRLRGRSWAQPACSCLRTYGLTCPFRSDQAHRSPRPQVKLLAWRVVEPKAAAGLRAWCSFCFVCHQAARRPCFPALPLHVGSPRHRHSCASDAASRSGRGTWWTRCAHLAEEKLGNSDAANEGAMGWLVHQTAPVEHRCFSIDEVCAEIGAPFREVAAAAATHHRNAVIAD